MSMFYDFSKIDGYNCPVKVVVSRRGLGKTFGKLRFCTERFITKGHRFIYVVETGDMVKELTRNNGEKFWVALLDYYGEQNTSKKRYFFSKVTELKIDVEESTDEEIVKKRLIKAKIVGGTIKINGETAGYIVDLNSYGELKRNNFNGVKFILVDEFISEKLDKTTLENPKKLSSIIQSIGRLRGINIYLLGNTVRQDDPILSRMGFKLDKYGYYKYYNKFGKLFTILHFVDPEEYPEFAEAYDNSVAGQFAEMLGETNEERNIFVSDLPDSRRLVMPCKYKKNGYACNVVRDNTIITIKELYNGTMACVPFAKSPTTSLYCMTEKEQGYKLGYHIICNKALRQSLMNMLRADIVYYYSEIEYNQLKLIIKGD